MLKINNVPRSLYIWVASVPSIALFVALIIINKSGIIIGKLNTGINKLLFPPFEEIAESMVNVAANPMQPRTVTDMNKNKESIGLPKSSIKVIRLNNDKKTFNIAL